MSSALPVEIRGLVKDYAKLRAVDGLDLSMRPGECVSLLGPNGAGKTTTVRVLTCFTPITSGSVRVFGRDVTREPREAKALMGVCPQEDNLDPDFSVRRNLLVYARYFGITGAIARDRAASLLALVGLSEKAEASIHELSGGMKRRLMLARALLNDPRLLVLDEPTTGLDPQARHLVWQLVREKKKEGRTILLTTHYMDEAASLSDRVILIDGGKAVLEGDPRGLVAREVGDEVVEIWAPAPELDREVRSSKWSWEAAGDRLYVYGDGGSGREAAKLIADRFPGQEHLVRRATLEDVFLRRTGRALRD